MSYLVLAREHPRFLAFGFTLTFFSSFGQTFFVSLFGADVRAEFRLSHGEFGSIYSLATLGSGLTLIWLGRFIDTVSLRRYTLSSCAALVGACAFLANVPSVVLLPVALFALRLAGQGLMSHTALTSMARYFHEGRGKAIAIAMLGFPVGEALLPLVTVTLNANLGWRPSWLVITAFVLVLLPPAVLWLLRGHAERDRRHREALRERNAGATSGPWDRQWTRREVIRDPRFYLVLPALLAPTFILTGLFFHQVHLAEAKGWSVTWLASCFVGFALGRIAGSLVGGPLIDRFRAARLLPLFLAPLGVALLGLWLTNHPTITLVYMIASGLTAGVGGALSSALWAEIYGVAHLGSIRALTSALVVLSTAASPASMGWLIDASVSVETISLLCLAYVVAGSLLTMVAFPAALRPAPGVGLESPSPRRARPWSWPPRPE